jgi:nitrogen-specific signal transduction histidine kinase/ActR/RegA family two-component response regulator
VKNTQINLNHELTLPAVSSEAGITAQVAEEANRLKSEFLAITSHELRTPLNAILGSLNMIQNGLCDSREEELEFVRKAYISSQHLLSVVENLLDLEKIQSGKLHAGLEPVSLKALFESVNRRTFGLAGQKGLTLSFDVPDGLDLQVRGDEARLQQILLNLVGNAIKFTMKGSVRIRAEALPEKGHAVVLVEDTGVGVPPPKQAKLFQAFVQADGSTTRKFGGTGLGLSISRQLIELMGGTLTLFSEGDEKGTRMTLTIPLFVEPILSEEREDGADPPHDQPLALVVEDDGAIRQFLETVLIGQGYRTQGVETADEALAALAVETPALITLDIGLPSNAHAQLRTGWNLLRVIDEWMSSHMQEGPRPSVLIVSGHDGEVSRRLAEEQYFCAPQVLPKPFTVHQLIAALPRRSPSPLPLNAVEL